MPQAAAQVRLRRRPRPFVALPPSAPLPYTYLPTSFYPVSIKVELLVNGSWTDISTFVYQRDPIQITGGRSQEGDTPNPATATLTLDNRDGRFSPLYSSGAYYPYLIRNQQIRISATAISVTGNYYSGYRFWGEVPNWPVSADLTGIDVFVTITATGPLRRVRQGGGKGSALARYYASLTGSFAPVAYWPIEDDPFTTVIGSGTQGGTNMSVTTGTPKWKAISDFNGSGPIAVFAKSTWDGLTGSFGSSGNDMFTVPGTYQWIASTTTVQAKVWGAGAGGDNGSQGAAGGSGEEAEEAALAVTPGSPYTVIVGTGGEGGDGDASANNHGADGGFSSIMGDLVLVKANGGKGPIGGFTGGLGGTGSINTTHRNGAQGGSNLSNFHGGASGASSAGTAAAGNPGNDSTGDTGAPSPSTPTGGGKGGKGGDGSASNPTPGDPGGSPGGGGGGGGDNKSTGWNWSGGNGAPGQVQLIYAPASVPTVNVIRFILLVPKHGGNSGKILLRAYTSSSVIDHVEVSYVTGGKLQLIGYNSSNVAQFDSTAQAWGIDNQTVMISIELQNSGANVSWAFKSIKPGSSTLLGSASGTVTTAACGNVTRVVAGPNADITKSAMGHISVQYALINLTAVSRALNGHVTEMGIDRFVRLANETALGNIPEFNEKSDHWGFEDGTHQDFTSTGCNLSVSKVWSSDGTRSLLLTADGSGSPSATSAGGLNGGPVSAGDRVSVAADVYSPVATINNVYIGIKWFDSTGAFVSETDAADIVLSPVTATIISHKATAPASAVRFAVTFGNHGTLSLGTLMYADNVRTHPRMGVQTRKELHHFLDEIEKLDQGIMKEAKELWGFKYRTRIRLFNQTVALTLDDAQNHLADPRPLPVVDDQKTKNHIVVHRHKGSAITVTLNAGQMSVQEPPAGAGRKKHHIRAIAEEDEQLIALATHLLNLGTAQDERYPTITVNLARNAVANLVSAIAGVEIGDIVKLINLPFWYPQTTVEQMVIGYTETLSPFEWTVQWNCVPGSPYRISVTSLRRW